MSVGRATNLAEELLKELGENPEENILRIELFELPKPKKTPRKKKNE
jgi:hypothetical protein